VVLDHLVAVERVHVPLCLRANGEPGAHVRVHVLVVDVIVPACVGVGVARLEGIARGGLFSGARNERKSDVPKSCFGRVKGV